MNKKDALFKYLLRLGDDRLVLGHRLSEWCGHAPVLEEDIAIANIALDLIGQAESFLNLAGKIEGKGRTEDDLAYLRDDNEFCNLQLLEQPRGDFADTIAKLFLFNTFDYLFLKELSKSSNQDLAALAAKAEKESRYHFRHSSEWLLRLGDGTPESHNRIQDSLNKYHQYADEMFVMDDVDNVLLEDKVVPDLSLIQPVWQKTIDGLLQRATLNPMHHVSTTAKKTLGRVGVHTAHLKDMLSVMQVLPRTYPNAKW